MASNEIVEKLNNLITETNAFSHEKDVVYFFVQIRKLMEREDIFDDHKSVKFYCDWALHPQKDRNHNDIGNVYHAIYNDCVDFYNEASDDSSDNILSLLPFQSLNADLRPIFERYSLDSLLLDELWVRFTKKLLGILNDQPLVNEQGENIKKIIITGTEKNIFLVKICFTKPIIDTHGYKHCDFDYGLGYIR